MLKFHLKFRDSLSQYCPFPVGAVYLTFDSSDPSTIWAGTTWTQIAAGTFLVASGTNYNLRTTGGAANVTLTSDQSGVPAHAHGLNGHVHSIGAHAHGLNSHTHTLSSHTHNYNKVNSPSGSTAITIAQLPKNYASFTLRRGHNGANTWFPAALDGSHVTIANSSRTDVAPLDLYVDNSHQSSGSTITFSGSGSGHTHTIDTTVTASAGPSNNTSGAASGNTANSTVFDSGAASGNTADNTAADASAAHENRPPYIAVAMWERTA